MNATMYFLINSLDVQRGGLTKASLTQANTFAKMGFDTHILTFNFDTRYDTIRKQLIDQGLLNKEVKILNLYEELCGQEKSLKRDEPSETGYLDPHIGHNAFRVYENGLYVRYKKYRKNGKLDFIDYFNEERYRTKREIYDEFGIIRKVSFMDYQLNKPRQMVFYRNNNQAYLSKWVNPENGKSVRVNVFNEDGSMSAIYSNDDELKTAWIEQVIKDKENPVLVSDARNTDLLMIKVTNKKAAKIWRLHSNHLTAPFEDDSEIAPPVRTGFDYLDKFDAALVLTKQQKEDIEKRFGPKENLFVMPHTAKQPSIKKNWLGGPKIVRDERLAVAVGRYAAIKNLNHLIQAFELVVKKVPDAKLEFWGDGAEKENLQQMIEKANLTSHIKINGYAQNPSEIYQGALFSVLASRTEGFSLSILESMANATPVVSYDINYGPKELIDDGINGILVPKNNIDQLAESMISMFTNVEKTLKMGKEALRKIEREFSEKDEEWVSIVSKALENRKIRS